MKNTNTISSIAPLHYQYPPALLGEIPDDYNLLPITFKLNEVEEFEVLFFHRLMMKNYGAPSVIEPEESTIKKQEDGTLTALGREWKYYLHTKSGGIIQVSSEDAHNRLRVYHVLPVAGKKVDPNLISEGEKFISDLLRAANRDKGKLLNVKEEFESAEKVQLFFLDNVYLSNYRSAELIIENAEIYENEIRNEVLKYDPNAPGADELRNSTRHFEAVGTYYLASITFLFMALEGFINTLYYAFIKDELRDDFFRQQNIDVRIDIKQKVLFLTSLCTCFEDMRRPTFFDELNKLTKYRNLIFHAKISDSLKRITIFESGFLYFLELEKDAKQSFPSKKQHLTRGAVIEFKGIVDAMIQEMLNMMTDQRRKEVEKYIQDPAGLPFYRDKIGNIRLGLQDDKD